MVDELPHATKFRWPILVVLDGSGDEDSMLDLKLGVAQRLKLIREPGPTSDPLTDAPGFISRLVQALGDLHAAGMIEADEQGLLWITEAGRRASETDVVALPETDGERPRDDDGTPRDPPTPTLGDYFFAAIESILGL